MKTLPRFRAVCVLFLALCCLLLGRSTQAQVSVTTYHNDNARTGLNANETILTPAKVQVAGQFGKLFSQPVDGYVYAQPLYVARVNIAGKGTHNVVFVATEGDTVYAFDADNNTGTNASPLWQASLIDNDHGVPIGVTATTVSSSDVSCTDLVPQIGITGTPVIDFSTRIMYVEAKSKEDGHIVHRLHALDIGSGAEKNTQDPTFPKPVVITASVPGIPFDSLTQLNRPGLLLLNHTIYIGYGSHCDNIPYNGWLLAYDTATLSQKNIFVTTPANGNAAGAIWMAGAGIAGNDDTDNIFVATGNGQFDGTDFGDSIVRLSLNLGLLDSFTPFNEPDRNANDFDLGSGGVLLLPQQPGIHPHLLVQAGKGGSAGGRGPFGAIYLVDQDQMTVNNQHFCGTCTDDVGVIVQELPAAVGGMWSMPAYWNNTVYFWGTGDKLKPFSLTNGLLGSVPSSTSQELYDFPGANMSISANGSTNGIVWSVGRKKIGQNPDGSLWQTVDVLQAHDAGDVSNTLFSSDNLSHKDDLVNAVKFSVPTVANGRVFVGTVDHLVVYGMHNYAGFLDHAGCDSIFGWAADRSLLNTAINVTIYDNGVAFATVLANSPRSDVGTFLGDNGLHGFGIPTPASMKDGNAHQVTVKFDNSAIELGTQLVLSCSIPPPPLQGLQDATNCDRIDGFAEDITQPNNPVDVSIYHPVLSHFTRQLVNELIATVTANIGSDLVPATAGKGSHGFLEYLPGFIKDGSTQKIHIEFTNNNQLLSNTDRLLDTSACRVTPPPGPYEGYFDSANCNRVDGWAWDPNFPTTPVDVEVIVDGSRMATLPANLFGPDLLQAQKGDGNHRFVWYIPAALKDNASHNVTVRVRGESATLPFSSSGASGTFSCAPPPPSPQSFNTPAGTAVTVIAPTPSGQVPYAEVTFDSVLVAGNTTFVPIDPTGAGTMPAGYTWPNAPIQPLLMEISTTASFTGNVTVKVHATTEQDAAEFAQLRVMHMENGQYLDRTLLAPQAGAPDFTTRTFQAQVTSFSPFMIVRELLPVTLTGTPQVTSITYGQSVAITAQLASPVFTSVPSGTISLMEGGTVLQTTAIFGAGETPFTASNLTAGTHVLTIAYSGDAEFQPGTSASFSVTVNPAPLTVTANGASRRYGDLNPMFTGSVAGLQNGDSITATYSTSATPANNAGSYAVIPTLSDPGSRLGNYAVTVQNGILTVTAAPLSVSVNNASRLYGDAAPAFTGTISGLLNGDNITAGYQSSATAASVVGPYSITATLSDPGGRLSNYTVSQGSGTLTVTPAPLQVTANNKTRMYGDPNPPLDGTITGPRNGDNIQAQYSTTATAQSLVGIYPITPALFDPGARLANYTVTIQNGTLTVTCSNIALALPTFNPAGGVYPLGQAITISEVTSGTAAIHYTTDGSVPTALSPVYTGPIIPNAPFTLTAIAMQPEYLDSGLAIAGYSNQIPISKTPNSQEVSGCVPADYTVTVPATNGVSGTLALSVSGLPAGATATFSPASISNSGSSTLTVRTSSTPKGIFPFTITVTNGTFIGTTTAVIKNKTTQACP